MEYTRNDIDLAYENIKVIIDRLLEAQNVAYKVDSSAPSTYKAMKASRLEKGYFVVYNGGDHGLLGQDYNIKFRALHDSMHFSNNLSFSFEDERKLSDITVNKFSRMAWNVLGPTAWECHCIRKVIDREIRGQIDYYELNKSYVKDQSQFVLNSFNL